MDDRPERKQVVREAGGCTAWRQRIRRFFRKSDGLEEKEEVRAVCDLSDALAGPNVMTKQEAEIAVRGKDRCSFSRDGQIKQT